MSLTVCKYIYETPSGLKVDIRKSGKRLTSTFSFRLFENRDKTLKAATEWRDQIHQAEFGYAVASRPLHGTTRSSQSHVVVDNFSFKIFPGMYCEKVNQKPSYFTVNLKSGKHRFSIKKLGTVGAYEKAVELALRKDRL